MSKEKLLKNMTKNVKHALPWSPEIILHHTFLLLLQIITIVYTIVRELMDLRQTELLNRLGTVLLFNSIFQYILLQAT